MIQGSEEWLEYKRGKITSSGVIDILKGTRGNYLASRDKYIMLKVAERLIDFQSHNIQSKSMRDGTGNEPIARFAYEARTGESVEQIGFIDHPTIKNFGCSPDGLVNQDGGVEIKCMDTVNHLSRVYEGAANIDRAHIVQMNTCMLCTGRAWWDYVLFDPNLPDNIGLVYYRFYPDKALQEEISKEVVICNIQIEAIVKKLKELA